MMTDTDGNCYHGGASTGGAKGPRDYYYADLQAMARKHLTAWLGPAFNLKRRLSPITIMLPR
jgi:hypothetical protein